MRKAYERNDMNDALLGALRDTALDGIHRLYRHESAREVVSAEAALSADELDRVLERSFPAQYTSDPGRVLSNSPVPLDMHAIALQSSRADHDALEAQVSALLIRYGRHTRALVRSVLEQAKR
jgi:hypothetical protein